MSNITIRIIKMKEDLFTISVYRGKPIVENCFMTFICDSYIESVHQIEFYKGTLVCSLFVEDYVRVIKDYED